jgi:hypothetical protein
MNIDSDKLNQINGLKRFEKMSRDELLGLAMEMTHAVYPHQKIYGEYCPIQIYIDCPPEKVFEYMANIHSLSEWTYSTRDFKESDIPGVHVGVDKLDENTKIFCKVEAHAHKNALTVDYHCAWDQGNELWMIYLNRIVPAELVLKKPGSIVFWQNCKHPYYENNPFPNLAPKDRPWVGEIWDLFFAGHTVEFENLKRILEFRHKNNLPIGPNVIEETK